jgi:hypothetical protein
VTRYHMHETTCRKGLFHDQGHVHPLKDRTFYINTGKAPKRKVLITKCKLSNSKLLSVTHSFLFKDQYMDLDNGYKKKRRHGMRRQSSSLIKTQLLLRKKFHIYWNRMETCHGSVRLLLSSTAMLRALFNKTTLLRFFLRCYDSFGDMMESVNQNGTVMKVFDTILSKF